MITNNISSHNYRLILEQIRKKMKENKVKPIKRIDNEPEQTYEQISKKQNKQSPKK